MGQMPATALIYRRGYVTEADRVVLEVFDPETATQMTPSKYFNSGGGDPTRGYVQDEKTQNEDALRNALAFLVGKVQTSFDPDETPFVTNLSDYIDLETKTVRSITGQLEIDYGKGVATVNAPCAQGACGFLGKAGKIDLADVAITSANDFTSVLVVSMDGKPLTESGKILIQAATHSRPYGWKEASAKFTVGSGANEKTVQGFEITSLGDYPLNMEAIRTQVALKGRAAPKKAMVVDSNGYAVRQAECSATNATVNIDLPAGELYTVVEFSRYGGDQ